MYLLYMLGKFARRNCVKLNDPKHRFFILQLSRNSDCCFEEFKLILKKILLLPNKKCAPVSTTLYSINVQNESYAEQLPVDFFVNFRRAKRSHYIFVSKSLSKSRGSEIVSHHAEIWT